MHGHFEFLPGFSSLSLTPILAPGPLPTQRVCLLLRIMRRGCYILDRALDLELEDLSSNTDCLQLSWGKSFNFSEPQCFHL